jgi:hypothetical protein
MTRTEQLLKLAADEFAAWWINWKNDPDVLLSLDIPSTVPGLVISFDGAFNVASQTYCLGAGFGAGTLGGSVGVPLWKPVGELGEWYSGVSITGTAPLFGGACLRR